MRCWVFSGTVPLRSSERKRAYARSTAGEPARTPRKLESWPPVERAPFRMGRLRSGAVSSSWMWNLLSLVFIASLSARSLREVSIGGCACANQSRGVRMERRCGCDTRRALTIGKHADRTLAGGRSLRQRFGRWALAVRGGQGHHEQEEREHERPLRGAVRPGHECGLRLGAAARSLHLA